jgi:flagellar hook-associated protein 3 FlgL
MRIATATSFSKSIDTITDQRAKLAELQDQVSSGRRITKLSTDPTAAADAERARSSLSRMDLEKRMVDYAQSILNQADSALAGASDLMMSAKESLIQAGNATMSPSDRKAFAVQLRSVRDELLSIANRKDSAGGWIFGGQGSASAPFVDGASVTYMAVPGEQRLNTEPSVPTSQDGKATFMDIQTPGATPGTTRSVFDQLASAITLLEDTTTTPAALKQGISDALKGAEAVLERFNLKRAEVGEYGKTIDDRRRLLEGSEVEVQDWLSSRQDLDFERAISQLANLQTTAEAAMKSYASISRMSLFNYIG